MFRASLRQSLSTKLAGVFDSFSSEMSSYNRSPIRIPVETDRSDTTTAVIKRRRRARRLAGHDSSGLRSTWF